MLRVLKAKPRVSECILEAMEGIAIVIRDICQTKTGEGFLWGGVNGQEELGWVQLTLTLPLDLS